MTLSAMLFAMLPSVLAPVAYAADKVLYAENFESTAVDSAPSGWSLSGVDLGSTIGVKETDSGKSLTLTQEGSGEEDQTASYTFETPLKGLISIDMNVMAEQTGKPSDFLVLKDSKGEQLLGLLFADDWENNGSKFLAVRTASGWNNLQEYEAGQWYSIHVLVNVLTQEFSVTVDGAGIDKGTDVAFLAPSTDIKQLEIATYKNEAGTFRIDTINVSTPENMAPVATGLSVVGGAQVLTGVYTYTDPELDAEGASVYKWYRGAAADGSDKAVIEGATGKTYTPVASDSDTYIFFEVTPVAAAGTAQGTPVVSAGFRVPKPDADATLSGDELSRALSDGKLVPVQYAARPSLDGDFNKWQSYTGIVLPSNAAQNKVKDWTGSKDVSAKAYYAYNDTTFFLAVDVTDDIHSPLPGGSNWDADGVQFAFGEGASRVEYGAALGKDGTTDIQRYSDGLAILPASSIQMNAGRVQDEDTERNENHTYYEFAIPWGAVLSSPPTAGNQVPFTMLVNDRDLGGRDGYLEWTGGIGSGKDVTQFGKLELLPQNQTWTSWLSGNTKVISGEAAQYTLYAMNTGNTERTLTLDLPAANLSGQSVRIPAHHLYKKTFTVTIENSIDIAAALHDDNLTQTPKLSVKALKSAEQVRAMLGDIESVVIPRLRAKLEQAAGQGFSTDYERVNLATIEKTVAYGLEDLDNDSLARAEYIADTLYALDAQAESSLDAYIAGTATPKGPVSRYQTGRTSIDGYSILGNTTQGANKPLIFSGYGMFEQAVEDVPIFQDLGTNMIDFNVYPLEIFKKPGLFGWSTYSPNGSPTTFEPDNTTAHSGSKSIKMQLGEANDSIVFQNPILEPNTTYHISAWVKTAGNPGANIFSNHNGWTTSSIANSEDWTLNEFSFTTGSDEHQLQVGIFAHSPGTVWIDDYTLVKDGTDTNLMVNNGLEEGVQGDNYYIVDETYLDNTVVPALQRAADHNIAVNVELGLQGFPDWIYQDYPDTKLPDNYGFLKADIENPRVQELYKAHVDILMGKIKDSPALQAINLSNESEYITNNGPYNLVKWHTYLPTIYASVEALNASYGTDYASFDEVPIPNMNSVTGNAYYFDYLTYKTGRLTAFHQMLADEVHKYAPDLPVHVKLMGFGVMNNDLMLRGGKDLEQMAQFSGYTGIDGGPEYGSGPSKFAEATGMLDMITSMKEQPTFNSENHIISDGETKYDADLAKWVSNWIWDGGLHGTGASVIWVWQRSYTTDYLQGSILNRPDAIAEVGHASLDLNRLVHEVTAFQNEKAKVGVLYSMTPRLYNSEYYSNLTKAYSALSYNGQKVGYVTENQINTGAMGGLDGYKLIVLPEVNNLSAETLANIKSWEAGGGHVVLIGTEENLIKGDEHNQPLPADDRDAVLNSVNTTIIAANPKLEDLRGTFFGLQDQLGLADVIVYDAATDQPVNEVEWRTTELSGKQLLSIVNYSNEDKTVYIKVNGVNVTPKTELISMSKPASGELALAGNRHLLYDLSQQTDNPPTSPGFTVVVPNEVLKLDAASFKPDANGLVEVKLPAGKSEVQLPGNAAMLLDGNELVLDAGGVSMTISPDVLKQLSALVDADSLKDAHISLTIKSVSEEDSKALLNSGNNESGVLKAAGQFVRFELALVTKDGQPHTLTAFDTPIQVALPYGEGTDANLLGVYTFNTATKAWEYVSGQVDKQSKRIIAELPHFSTYAVLEYAKTFNDVAAGHWAFEAIRQLAAKHIVKGITDSSFAPNQQVTRAEFAGMLIRALGLKAAAESEPFSDVPADAWYAEAVSAAYGAGLINGRTSDTFAPDAPINREEIAIMLVRAFQYISGDAAAGGDTVLTDEGAVSPWAMDAVKGAIHEGLMSGVGAGKFAPELLTKRAEAAQAIYNLLLRMQR